MNCVLIVGLGVYNLKKFIAIDCHGEFWEQVTLPRFQGLQGIGRMFLDVLGECSMAGND
jgi:hypothetical protein